MKKLMLLSVALLGFAFCMQAQGIFKVTKKNGSASGFDHIKQTTDSLGNTLMICENPGKSKGEFLKPPQDAGLINYNKIMAFVEKQIAEGKLTGETPVSGTVAKWEGTDAYNYTLIPLPSMAASPDKQAMLSFSFLLWPLVACPELLDACSELGRMP